MSEAMDVVTPEHVERRLRSLGRELDDAHRDLEAAEHEFAAAKTAFELTVARKRLQVRDRTLERGVKVTVQEIEDTALIGAEAEYTRLNAAEAVVKATRANNARIKTQIDIARSVGTSVRAALDVS